MVIIGSIKPIYRGRCAYLLLEEYVFEMRGKACCRHLEERTEAGQIA